MTCKRNKKAAKKRRRDEHRAVDSRITAQRSADRRTEAAQHRKAGPPPKEKVRVVMVKDRDGSNLERRAMNEGWGVRPEIAPQLTEVQVGIALDPGDKRCVMAFSALLRAEELKVKVAQVRIDAALAAQQLGDGNSEPAVVGVEEIAAGIERLMAVETSGEEVAPVPNVRLTSDPNDEQLEVG